MKYLSLSLLCSIILIITIFPLTSKASQDHFFNDRSGAKIPNHFIIVFNEDIEDPRAVAEEMSSKHGLLLKLVYKKAIKGFAAKIPPGRLKHVESDSRVNYIEPDLKVFALKPPPNDRKGGNDGGGNTHPSQVIPTGVDRIDADLSPTADIDSNDEGMNVDIAIIDTGVDTEHNDLRVHKHVRCSGTGSNKDQHGHGTHVAGIAAAIDNDIGVVGVAPGARLWGVKVLDATGSGTLSCVIAGVDYVTNNSNEIEVANMSLGFQGSSDALDTAISNSVASGVTYVVAAGNSLDFIDLYSPANHPDVITVSAITDTDGTGGGSGSPSSWTGADTNSDGVDDGEDDSFAWFSNFGGCFIKDVEIAAPGVDIYSTWLGGYETVSGTSMSAPHVAGAAALVKVKNPSYTPSQVLAELQSHGVTNGINYFTDDPDNFYELILDIHSSFCAKTPPNEPLVNVSLF